VSHLIRVETYEIPGGMDDHRRVRVVLRTGAGQLIKEGTYDYPNHGTEIDRHEACLAKLIDQDLFNRIESHYHVGTTPTGHKFTIFLKPESQQ
jgi:hypothetical protein